MRFSAVVAVCILSGCGIPGNLDSSREPLNNLNTVASDAGPGDGGSDGCDGDEAPPGYLCGFCRSAHDGGAPCVQGACVSGVCVARTGGDAGHPDAGSDGCDGDEAPRGYLCGLCFSSHDGGAPCLEGTCVAGVCVAQGGGDAGQPDAGEPDAGQPDAGQPDAGQPDAGSDGCDGDEAPAGFLCGVCAGGDAGANVCYVGVCEAGICKAPGGDAGIPDAG